MRLVVKISIVLFLSFLVKANAQNEEEPISWSPNLRLTWKDFKGDVDKRSAASAITASGISYSYSASINGNEVEVDHKVQAYFYPFESWYKPEECNHHMLKHEQLHFDISALFAQKFRQRLQRTTFSKNVKAEIGKIYREIIKELDAFQDQYDKETDFSRNAEAQLQWNAKIAKALKEAELHITY